MCSHKLHSIIATLLQFNLEIVKISPNNKAGLICMTLQQQQQQQQQQQKHL